MSWPGELARKIGALLRRRRLSAELEEEMRLHLELRQEEKMQAGMAPAEARRAARRQFGNTTLRKEDSQLEWGWSWLEQLAQDAIYGIRAMRASPGVTV